jgi:hypothetical protein
MRVIIIALWLLSSCSNEEHKQQINTTVANTNILSNKSCPELVLCPKIIKLEKECSENYEEDYCTEFVETYKKLTTRSTCMRSFDTSPVPAIWVCGKENEYPSVFSHSNVLLEMLSLKFSIAKKFFESNQFRDILSGESAEAYTNRSLALENELKGDLLIAEKVFTQQNYDLLISELKGELLSLSVSNYKRLYNFLDVDAPRYIDPKSSYKHVDINYNTLAKMIASNYDIIGIYKYLKFMARTDGSADEQRSTGTAHLYNKYPDKFLYSLSLISVDRQNIVIDRLAFGLGDMKLKSHIKVDKFETLNQKIIKKLKEIPQY